MCVCEWKTVRVFVCVCVCVCVWARERGRECVCVCVCVRERERESESVCGLSGPCKILYMCFHLLCLRTLLLFLHCQASLHNDCAECFASRLVVALGCVDRLARRFLQNTHRSTAQSLRECWHTRRNSISTWCLASWVSQGWTEWVVPAAQAHPAGPAHRQHSFRRHHLQVATNPPSLACWVWPPSEPQGIVVSPFWSPARTLLVGPFWSPAGTLWVGPFWSPARTLWVGPFWSPSRTLWVGPFWSEAWSKLFAVLRVLCEDCKEHKGGKTGLLSSKSGSEWGLI